MSALPNSVFGRINQLMTDLNTVKTASVTKRATELGLSGEGKQDPGGYEGKSSHPSAMAATNVQKTPLGSHGKELESEVKKTYPTGVDNTAPGSGGSQDDKQMNQGTNQSAVGEDSAVEDKYRMGKKDDKRQGDRGGTEHPANAEKVPDSGMPKSGSFQELTKQAYAQMNSILADIAEDVPLDRSNTGVKSAASAGAHAANNADPQAFELQKRAAAQTVIEQTINEALTNASLVGDFLTKYASNYQAELYKLANDGQMGGGMEEAGGGAPPGGPEMPPEAGGAPPGGPGGEGGAPPGGGGGDPNAEIDQFIQALLQMGATPEQIEQHLQQLSGGGGGGGPGGGGAPPDMGGGDPAAGGGAPPDMGAAMGKAGSARLSPAQAELLYVTKKAAARFRSGNWRPRTTGVKEAQERGELQNYILEVCGLR